MVPVITLPCRPLSKRTSTDSCNILFSLRTMISGAFKSIRRFNRLLRLITLRYRSFRSDVANLPPSRGTNGRKSGGRTGITSIIIQTGFNPLRLKASTIFSRLDSFWRFATEPVELISSLSSLYKASRSMLSSNFLTASAPIPASNFSPYTSRAS